MKISRRDFIHAGCSAVSGILAFSIINKAEANFRHGYIAPAGPGTLNNQIVVNAGPSALGYINIAKQFNLPGGATPANFPTTLTANGFPNASPLTQSIPYSVGLDPSYFGHYSVWMAATAASLYLPGASAIIYNGGTCAGLGGNSGTITGSGGNLFIGSPLTLPIQSAPIEFAFGGLIASVTNNGGLVQFTNTSTLNSLTFVTGIKVKLNNLTYNGAAFPNGPNADGSWVITVSGNTFTLNGSGALNVALISVVGSGGPGTQTEFIFVPTITPTFLSGGSNNFSNFTNLVWCRTGDATAVIAGQLAAPAFVAAMANMKPRFIRFMDYGAVQGDRSSGYGPKGAGSYRTTTAMCGWGYQCPFIPDYYTPSASITNTGVSGAFSDVYTCSGPTASPASGAYQEGETIVGQISGTGTNAGYTPALNVSGRGIAPVYEGDYGSLKNVWFGGSAPPTGTTLILNFTGAGLSAAPFVLNYTTSTSVLGPAGVLDTSVHNIYFNLQTLINTNSTLGTAGITVQNPSSNTPLGSSVVVAQIFYCTNLAYSSGIVASLNAGLVITFTDPSSSMTANFGTVGINFIPSSFYVTFVYSTRRGGWLMQYDPTFGGRTGGTRGGGPPLEFYEDLCIRAGCGMYLCVGQMWSNARITETVTHIANAGVQELLLEFSNETWNDFAQEQNFALTEGTGLGFNGNASNAFDPPQMGWYGIRTIQMSQLAAAAWTAAGKSRSTLFINTCFQLGSTNGGSSTTISYKLNGSNLDAASPSGNAVAFAAFGGYGSTSINTNYSAAPNRPVDFIDAIGQAPYWDGNTLNTGNGIGGLITGIPLSSYNGLLLAAYNYVYGNSAQQSAALNFLYSGGPSGTGDLYGNVPLVWSNFTASVTGTSLTVSGVTGQIMFREFVNIPGVPANTYIIGGSGANWTLSQSGSASSVAGTGYAYSQVPSATDSQNMYVFNSGDISQPGNIAGYFTIGTTVASYDSGRLSLPAGQVGQAKLGVINYEGGWQMSPVQLSDISQVATALNTLGYTNGYSSGLPGAASGPTGASDTSTNAAYCIAALLNGNAMGAYTFTGTPNSSGYLAGFKNDSRCFDLITRFLNECTAAGNTVSTRVSLPAWFGFWGQPTTGDYWSLYENSGVSLPPFQAVNALAAI